MATNKTNELENMRLKQEKIRQDFQYNLSLLQERDAELDRYETLLSNLSDKLRQRDEEVNLVNTRLAEADHLVIIERERLTSLEERFESTIESLNSEVGRARTATSLKLMAVIA